MHGADGREEGEGVSAEMLWTEVRDIYDTDVGGDVTPALPAEVRKEESIETTGREEWREGRRV